MRKYQLQPEVAAITYKADAPLSESSAFIINRASAKINHAMHELFIQLEGQSDVSIRDNPKKGVVSNSNYPSKGLKLPLYGKIIVVDKDAQLHEKNTYGVHKVSKAAFGGEDVDVVFAYKCTQTEYEDEAFCAAAFVPTSDGRDDCNCVVSYLPVSMFGCGQKKLTDKELVCHLPYISNFKALKKGDELMLFREKADNSKEARAKAVGTKRKVNVDLGCPSSGSRARAH